VGPHDCQVAGRELLSKYRNQRVRSTETKCITAVIDFSFLLKDDDAVLPATYAVVDDDDAGNGWQARFTTAMYPGSGQSR
jgi:hypothetical protein